MIIATGIDIIEISRIESAFARRGPRFRDRIFTKGEISYCESRAAKFPSYAARFAAKEALFKAIGTGWSGGVAWLDVEVVRCERGRPEIKLYGRALELFRQMGANRIHLSLSHSQDMAAAQVMLET